MRDYAPLWETMQRKGITTLQKTPAVMINRQVFFYFISLITDQFCLR